MKIKSDLRAGMTFAECDAQRNWYKKQVQYGDCSGNAPDPMGACTKVFDSTGKCLYKKCPYPPFQQSCY